MKQNHPWSLALATWLLSAPVLAAPQITKVESVVGIDQGLLFSAGEALDYTINSQESQGKNLVFTLNGATLGSIKSPVPTNFGVVTLNASPLGVTVRVIFSRAETTYKFEPRDANRSLLLKVSPTNVAQVPFTAPQFTEAPPPPQERITIKARNQEVRDTLTLLSRISRTSIVADPTVQKRVNVSLTNSTLDDALKAIAEIGDLNVRKEGEVYVVSQRPPVAEGGAPTAPSGLLNLDDPRPRGPEDNPGQRLVSVIANDTELAQILKEIANQANVELVITGQLGEVVSARLVNRTFEDALNQLLAGTNFGFSRNGNVYRLGDATPGSATSKAFTQIKVLRLTNSSAKTVVDLLPPVFSQLGQGIKIDEARNALIISGPPLFQAQIASLIQDLDTPIPEVSFGVKIIELSEDGSQALRTVSGFRLGTGGTTPTNTDGSTTSGPLSLAGVIARNDPLTVLAFDNFARILNVVNGLVNSGKAKTLTDTKITTISGQQAVIQASQDINITTQTNVSVGSVTTPTTQIQTIQAGTIVQITPIVQANGNVFTNIAVESSIPGQRDSQEVAPDVSRRRVDNKIILRDGETVEIGGLIQRTSRDNKVRFPILGYLPLIGDLLSSTDRSEETSELLVFVTAYIDRRAPRPEVVQTEPPTPRLDLPNEIKLLPSLP